MSETEVPRVSDRWKVAKEYAADVQGLIASPFDADAYIVKVDAGNALVEGGAGRANNEARF